MTYDLVGAIILGLAAVAVVVSRGRRYSRAARRLLLVALVMRLVGAAARFQIIFGYYGVGDALRYYEQGLVLARQLWAFTTSPLSPDYWVLESARWGTQFTIQVSGLALAIIGPTIRGEFIVFALFAFLGTIAIVVAFARLHPTDEALRFAWLVMLWPSVWFWSSSVGKEALVVLAVGLVTLGYTGVGNYIRWPALLAGLALAFMLRPHVAFVLAFAAVAAEWLTAGRRWTLRRVLEGAAGIVLTAYAFQAMAATYGLADADLEGVAEFVEWHMGQTVQGGSRIDPISLSPVGIPLAFMNVWMRPFPWEAHNTTALLSSLELVVLWGLVWRYRRGLPGLLKHWRQHRLVRFGVILCVAYTLMIGFTFANLGLIARQRAPIFPFVLMILVAVPRFIASRRARSREKNAATMTSSAHEPTPSTV